MIIKGKSVAGAKRLAVHLARTDTNERMELLETHGVVAEDLAGALKEMEAVASIARNCERPFYHASINTPTHERMTAEQRDIAINRLAKALGLENQPRVVVAHIKDDREHFHIAFSRIDTEDNFRVISDSHNYRKHEQVARQLEREFGHERVQGAHHERDGKSRPERTPSHKQMQQAERTKIPVEQARAHVTQLWQQSENGKAFQDGLKASGWMLAKGDRRDYVVVDSQGGTHSLTRITGIKAEVVRSHLADIDRNGLPTPQAVRQAQREHVKDQAAHVRAQHTALVDAVRMTGSQSMVNVEAIQMQRMRRRAEQVRREAEAQTPQDNSSQETTDRRAAQQSRKASRVTPNVDKTPSDAKQKGRGDTERER